MQRRATLRKEVPADKDKYWRRAGGDARAARVKSALYERRAHAHGSGASFALAEYRDNLYEEFNLLKSSLDVLVGSYKDTTATTAQKWHTSSFNKFQKKMPDELKMVGRQKEMLCKINESRITYPV
ncbi:hypothetical protein EVAR_38628_1 [Eumeta japonica]|uniref:Uncharacterized protein n=1 Tax=Eumeta variegata TaxID=151549 RepID=A0A4C1Y0R8_EUMVA|nr:hypothetical protein EVAR_38628_1 [Eumeta japonica]